MTNGNWDNEGAPRKRGMPTWAKILLGCLGGCFLLFVLLIGSCVGGAAWIARNGLPEAADSAFGKAVLDEPWGELAKVVKALRTVEGTRELYHKNPGLAECFATEDDFLKAAEEWRPRLADFPERRPSLKELIREHEGRGHSRTFKVQTDNQRTTVDYQLPKGATIHLETESGKVVDLRVE